MSYKVETVRNGQRVLSFPMRASSDGDESIENVEWRAKDICGRSFKLSQIAVVDGGWVITFAGEPGFEIRVSHVAG